VILSALTKFDAKEMPRLLRLLEVVIVRYILIGGGNTGRFETTCAILARKIHRKEVQTANYAFQELKESYPPDDEFQQAFRVKQERSNQKVQYFLRGIEKQARKQANKGELEPGDLTIEHILPKNPGGEWSAVIAADPTVVEECANRIGNTALLSDAGNLKAGGKAFTDKRKFVEDSELITTTAIAKHGKWDRQDIDHHQAYLAKLAVSAWRFDAAVKPKQEEDA